VRTGGLEEKVCGVQIGGGSGQTLSRVVEVEGWCEWRLLVWMGFQTPDENGVIGIIVEIPDRLVPIVFEPSGTDPSAVVVGVRFTAEGVVEGLEGVLGQ
jgi:hypothetical protein